MSVRHDDDITLLGHKACIPAVREVLTNSTLRTTLTVKQGRVLLAFIEVRRINNPCQHITAVGSLNPSFLYGRATIEASE